MADKRHSTMHFAKFDVLHKVSARVAQLSPIRSLYRFNVQNGAGNLHVERIVRRGLAALPLLAIFILACTVMNALPATPFAWAFLDRGELVLEGGRVRVQILDTFYNVQWLDSLLSLANVFFMPSIYGYDPVSRAQAVSFLSDGGVVLAIWWLESMRGGDKPWFLRYPSILTLAGQLVGLGVICPLYCFLSYVHSPTCSAVSTDRRSSAMALLPALVLGHYIPASAMLFWPNLNDRQSWLFLWQLYPVHVSLAYYAISYIHSATTKGSNRPAVLKLNYELIAIRVCIGFSVLLGSAAWLWTRYSSPFGAAAIFLPTTVPALALPSLKAFSRQFLRWDEVFVFGSSFVWICYVWGDAKRAGLMWFSWASLLLGATVVTTVLGPGATLGIGWLWREEVLAAKWEKEVLMLEVAAKVDALLKANGA